MFNYKGSNVSSILSSIVNFSHNLTRSSQPRFLVDRVTVNDRNDQRTKENGVSLWQMAHTDSTRDLNLHAQDTNFPVWT